MNFPHFNKAIFWCCAVADIFCADGKGPFNRAMEAMIRTGRVVSLAGNRLVDKPLEIGGRIERYSPYAEWLDLSSVRASQKKFIDDSAELRKAIAACRQGACPELHNIRLFSDMLDRVKGIQDQRMQVLIVQAWINLFMRYDVEEYRQSRDFSRHHSLKEALTLKKGVCDEVARLKLFALEELGFPHDDVRFVRFSALRDGKLTLDSHSAAFVRLGQQRWVLHNFHPYSARNHVLTSCSLVRLLTAASVLEDHVTGLNLDGRSRFMRSDRHFLPDHSFNSAQRAAFARIPYLGNFPGHVVGSSRISGPVRLSEADCRNPVVMEIFRSVRVNAPPRLEGTGFPCHFPDADKRSPYLQFSRRHRGRQPGRYSVG